MKHTFKQSVLTIITNFTFVYTHTHQKELRLFAP